MRSSCVLAGVALHACCSCFFCFWFGCHVMIRSQALISVAGELCSGWGRPFLFVVSLPFFRATVGDPLPRALISSVVSCVLVKVARVFSSVGQNAG